MSDRPDVRSPSPNDDTPLARAARDIIWNRYDGAPPWHTPIPNDEWDAAVNEAVARQASARNGSLNAVRVAYPPDLAEPSIADQIKALHLRRLQRKEALLSGNPEAREQFIASLWTFQKRLRREIARLQRQQETNRDV